MLTTIGENLQRIRQKIFTACTEAGRDPGEVTLVAVSKRQPIEAIREALAHGQVDLGESYAQELRDKAMEVQAMEVQGESGLASASGHGGQGALPAPRWHFIGPIQRNKVKYLVGTASLLHGVDSPRLLSALQERAQSLGICQELLVQVNLAEEPQKAGVHHSELIPLLESMEAMSSLRCVGLMLMPPWDPGPEASRPLFRELRETRDRIMTALPPNVDLVHLSMGMSHDFHVAIWEGATLVRVGTAIFGER